VSFQREEDYIIIDINSTEIAAIFKNMLDINLSGKTRKVKKH